eukprot:Em0001g843a
MTLKGALLLSRLVNRSAHLWFAIQFAVSWCARGERGHTTGSHELPTIEDFETVPSPPSSHVTPEAAKSTSHSSQPATTKQVSTPSRSQIEPPLRAGTTRRTALSGSEGLELNGADCGDERSDYELQRARSIRLNKEFLHSQQMIANVVDEADAVLVTKKWWSRSHATKPSLNSVVSAIDDAGFQGQRRIVR